MEMTVQPAFEDGFSEDPYDIVSVYIDNELRGVANVEFLEAVRKYVTFITVYHHEATGENLEFHLWDASEGKEYVLLENDHLFSSNSSLGTVASPLIIEPDAYVQSIRLESGWTWFSINVNIGTLPVDLALRDVWPSNGDLIKGEQHYSMFHDELNWVGSLTHLEAGKTYKIYSNEGWTLRFTGKAVDLARHELDIFPGWNWIGYASQQILDINGALDAYSAGDGDRIKSQTAFAAYLGDVDSWEGSLKYLMPGEGYMLKSAEGDSVTFMLYEPATEKIRSIEQKYPITPDGILGTMGVPLVLTAEPIGDELVPYVYYLNQNYPNPFNPETVIEYGLPQDSKVRLDVFNTLGQKVATIVNERQVARRYKVQFNARDAGLASGIYIYQLKAGNTIKRHKFVFIK